MSKSCVLLEVLSPLRTESLRAHFSAYRSRQISPVDHRYAARLLLGPRARLEWKDLRVRLALLPILELPVLLVPQGQLVIQGLLERLVPQGQLVIQELLGLLELWEQVLLERRARLAPQGWELLEQPVQLDQDYTIEGNGDLTTEHI